MSISDVLPSVSQQPPNLSSTGDDLPAGLTSPWPEAAGVPAGSPVAAVDNDDGDGGSSEGGAGGDRRRSRHLVIDSDSESESGPPANRLVLSDDDDDGGVSDRSSGQDLAASQRRSRRCLVLADDSDSEVETGVGVHAVSDGDNSEPRQVPVSGKSGPSSESAGGQSVSPRSSHSSRADDSNDGVIAAAGENSGDSPHASTKGIRAHRTERNGTSKKNGGDDMARIRSDSQRRLRESRLNLPYHRPKQCTLQAFLARKRQLQPMVMGQLRTADDRERLARACAERERAIELMYRNDDETDGGQETERAASPGAVVTLSAENVHLLDKDVGGENVVLESDGRAAKQPQYNERVQQWLQQVESDAGEGSTADTQSNLPDTGVAKNIREPVVADGCVATVFAENNGIVNGDDMTDDDIQMVDEKVPAEKTSDTKPADAPVACAPGCDTNIEQTESDKREETNCKPLSCRVAAGLNSQLLQSTPTLSRPQREIVLDSDTDDSDTGENGVDKFIERCARHVAAGAPRGQRNKHVSVPVLRLQEDSAGNTCAVADHLCVAVENQQQQESSVEQTPGASRQKLRGQLLANIRRRREEALVQRQEAINKLREAEEVGYDDLPSEEDVLTDVEDDEAEEDSSAESEPEENDVVLRDCSRQRSGFVDDEAEVSEESEEEAVEDDVDDLPDLQIEFENAEDTNKSETLDGCDTEKLSLFLEEDSEQMARADSVDRVVCSTELFSTQDRGGAPARDETEVEIAATTQSFSQLSNFSLSHLPPNVSEHRESLTIAKIDSVGVPTSPCHSPDRHSCGSDFDLHLGPLQLSPAGPSLRQSPPPHRGTITTESAIGALLDPEPLPESADDLLSLCSGKFETSGVGVSRQSSGGSMSQLQQRRVQPGCGTPSSIASLLLDDGNANMPLDTPLNRWSQFVLSDDEDGEPQETPSDDRLALGHPSDEDSQLDDSVRVPARRRRKVNHRPLVFSDDEDANVADSGGVRSESADSGEHSGPSNPALKTNFLEVLQKTNHNGATAGGFFDDEAELSGSDAPSDDEDDGEDLDEMEEEAADLEKFDENRIREQVERMHYKKALDEDMHELRLFQQRFLEHGDMHGPGRQKKFRWNNLDDEEDGLPNRDSDVEEAADQEAAEIEERWRLERHERQKWLQQNSSTEVDAPLAVDEPTSDTSVFVKPTLQLSNSKSSASSQSNNSASISTTNGVSGVKRKCMRGSFLCRDQRSLTRLASAIRTPASAGGLGSASQPRAGAAGARESTNRTFSILSSAQSDGCVDSPMAVSADDVTDITTQTASSMAKRKSAAAKSSNPAPAKKCKLETRSFSVMSDDRGHSNSLFNFIS